MEENLGRKATSSIPGLAREWALGVLLSYLPRRYEIGDHGWLIIGWTVAAIVLLVVVALWPEKEDI